MLHRVVAMLILAMTFSGMWATSYVFIYNGNYLGINASGNIENYSTFNAAYCVWTCYNGANEAALNANNPYALRITYNGNTWYMYSSDPTNGTAGATITTSTTAQNTWRLTDNRLNFRPATWTNNRFAYYRSGWRTSNTGQANNNNGYLSNNGRTDYRATAYAGTNHPATGGIKITANPTTIEDVNGRSSLQTTFTNYIQPYVTFNFNGGNHNVYGNADHGNTTPTPLYDLNGSTHSWTMENAGTYATIDDYGAYAAGLTYSSASTTERVVTVKLTVSNAAYNFNQEATTTVTLARAVTNITSLSQITDPNGTYKLVEDVDASSSTMIENFNGYFDGNFHVISNLTHPIFGTLNGAEVKNVIVDNVNISRDGDAGAIACQANGNSRIYNCGVLSTGSTFEFDKSVSGNTSTIETTGNGVSVGGIVGAIFNNTRVANCFSYADVSATGGNNPHASGIVGWADNWVNSNNSVTNGTNCFVVNCMFYGNLTGGQRSPIVYVNGFNNTYTTWSYFRYKSIPNVTGLNQNGAMAAQEDMWLKRFKFFQSAVTNHRDMAAVYIFNDANRINEIAQWYIDESIAPWPILRKAGPQKSILNRTIPNTGNANEGNLITNGKRLLSSEDGTTVLDADVTQRYNMNVGSNGMLHVNFDISGIGVASGGQTYSVELPITDMDFAHYDYTWGKVVLPFANEFEGWTPNYEYICTGWEITSVTGGTVGTLTDYNFADRNCTAKDIYNATNNPIIFAQGGNWIVPYGVTSIDVKAHFAKAYYLSDPNYDCSGNGGNAIGGTRPTTYHGRTVYTTVQNAWGAMENKTLPHDQALVLVGNYHYNSNQSGNYTNKGCTIMSIDEDKDQQPDFGWYNSDGNYRANWMPMRWDFIALYGFNMVQTNTAPPGIAIPVTVGWLEFTETTICRTYEFESNDGSRTNNDDNHSRNAWIINGCYFQQMVRTFIADANKLSYMKVGGSAYIKEFFYGNHSGTNYKFTLRPVIITGGEIAQCFLTGMGNKNEITTTNNNVRFYCAGGKIDKYLSVYNGYPVVDATMKVDHARIGRFFGGGTSPKAQLSGNINVTMDNSYVDFFCGGPEFGDMGNGKTVTVSTTGSIFGEYYGAGFGGTALTRITNGDGQKTPFGVSGRSRLNYNAGEGGFEVSYEMEALLNGGGDELYRYYDYRADLSMATVGPTTTTAEKCLFLSNFYGGGCQGKVNGTINSSLTNCDVVENAFGGGYKAAATTIDVYPTGGNTWQVWDGTYKAYSDPIYPTPEIFTWQHGNNNRADDDANILYTTADMTQMGRVTGNITITINGGTIGKNVYGGGNESPSDKQTNVTITGGAQITGDVYGGANMANVGDATIVDILAGTVGNVFGANNVSGTKSGTVTVNINQAAEKTVIINNNVYGGGNLADYTGDPLVNMMNGTVNGSVFGGGLSAKVTGNTDVEVTGGNVNDAVYGGGALADVTGNTTVNLLNGTVNNVYGGGLGRDAVAADAEHGIAAADAVEAIVGGNTNITLNGSVVKGSIFGCNNVNGTPKGHAKVLITTTTANPDSVSNPNAYHVTAVYGGGNQAAYIPTNTDEYAEVVVEGCDNSLRYVYGGGNAASTPKTQVTINGGTIFNVFGGGNGAGAGNPGADVGYLDWLQDEAHKYGEGTTNVNIYGGIITSVFGGSNTKGNIRTASNVNLDDHGVCTFQVGDVYGAGNEAEMYGNGNLIIGCIPGLDEIYGGAKNADIHGNVSLTITNGEFGKVFGGNNLGGNIAGSITVHIEETGCRPIKIGELYGGGNLAAYTAPEEKTMYPEVNIKSFTTIGTVFGGGLGMTDAQIEAATHDDMVAAAKKLGKTDEQIAALSDADLKALAKTYFKSRGVIKGNPHVNIGLVEGKFANGGTYETIDFPAISNKWGNKLGTIGEVFGGGNASDVAGDTYVNIGTLETVTLTTGENREPQPMKGVNISGNVYGGGNAAHVTGKTHVQVGRPKD
ncbi:MAG: hypothetical protein MJZ08_00430 [Bacteroidaceae bacterium]|nr:hypothetical protein [Bacteroidaceae bacterium]